MYRFKCCECGKPLTGWYWYRRRIDTDFDTMISTEHTERYCFKCASGLIDERSVHGLLVGFAEDQEGGNGIHDRGRA